MYIQPYEPQEMNFGAPALTGYGTPPACPPATSGDDAITTLPWTQGLPELGDAAGALNDAPFGSLGIGAMLSSLTGMMQQLVQMMQSLVGRMGGEASNPGSGNAGGCTQGPRVRS